MIEFMVGALVGAAVLATASILYTRHRERSEGATEVGELDVLAARLIVDQLRQDGTEACYYRIDGAVVAAVVGPHSERLASWMDCPVDLAQWGPPGPGDIH